MKLELTKTKLYLIGTAGVLALGTAGVGIAAHAASPAPSASAAAATPKAAQAPTAAETPDPAESPAAAGTTAAAEAPETPTAEPTDATGGTPTRRGMRPSITSSTVKSSCRSPYRPESGPSGPLSLLMAPG